MNSYYTVLYTETDIASDATIDFSPVRNQSRILNGTWANVIFDVKGLDSKSEQKTYQITVKVFFVA